MKEKTFDVAIIGGGVAGIFAAKKLSQNNDIKSIIFDAGRPQGKRRHQLSGWLGCLPNSDGKLYHHDIENVAEITGKRSAKKSGTWVKNYIKSVVDVKEVKDKKASIAIEKKLAKFGYTYHYNDYIQMYPKEIHVLSKTLADQIEESKNVTYSFDNEVYSIHRQKNLYCLSTHNGDFFAKKIIFAVGRSGWRWATKIFNNFGIVESNNVARFGIHAEISSSYMKDFHKANISFYNSDMHVGPLSWGGTIIPEDHYDLAISAFRSNENRWKSDKVSFKIIGNIECQNGVQEMDRLGSLAFVLANERISKERINSIINGRSKISPLTEYDWLKGACENLQKIIPDFISKGYFHIPTIMPLPPKVNLDDSMCTEMDDFYLIGESAGIHGLMGAAVSGVIVADKIG